MKRHPQLELGSKPPSVCQAALRKKPRIGEANKKRVGLFGANNPTQRGGEKAKDEIGKVLVVSFRPTDINNLLHDPPMSNWGI